VNNQQRNKYLDHYKQLFDSIVNIDRINFNIVDKRKTK